MKQKSEFRKYVDATQALPDDVTLGNIVWHTISDGNYDLGEIEKLFEALDMSPEFIPAPTTQINAFQKACTRARHTAKPYEIGRNTHEIMAIREVVRDKEIVRYDVVREVRDSRARKLRHDSVAELVLYRPGPRGGSGRIDRSVPPVLRSKIFDQVVDPIEMPYIQQVLDTQYAEFHRLYTYIDGDKFRWLVRDYLGFLNAIMMKPGVYFVHRNRNVDLEKLATFVDSMAQLTHTESKVDMMPIPDLKRLRQSVIDAYQVEAVKEFNEVVAQVSKIRATRDTITPEAFAKVREQYNAVSRKALEYTRTLGVTQDMTAGAAEIALESLAALQADLQKQLEAK